MFCKKDVLRNFAKFTGKRLCGKRLLKQGSGTGHLFTEHRFTEYRFIEHLRATASEKNQKRINFVTLGPRDTQNKVKSICKKEKRVVGCE